MTSMTATRRLLFLCAVGIAAIGASMVAAPQSATGMMPNWSDLEAWSRPVESTRQTDVGLGLQVNGAGGVTMISFSARLDSGSPRTPPKEIVVIAAPSVLSNPNTLRTPGLRFIVDENIEGHVVIDMGARIAVDDPTPRAIVHSETGPLGADEFIRLCQAKTMRAVIFGSDVTFRPDQLRAIADLGDRLHLAIRK